MKLLFHASTPLGFDSVNTLFEKLGVKSRTEAMRAGLERGLIRLR
jgi:hypothetical protein